VLLSPPCTAAKKAGGAKAEKGVKPDKEKGVGGAPTLRARAAPRAQFGQESLPDDYDDLEDELDDAPEGALRAEAASAPRMPRCFAPVLAPTLAC
jgi:hypothetical protein